MELSSRFKWHGRSIAWHKLGTGPPLVMCHGTPWSSVVWDPFARALSRDFSVYLWDMPGYGQSSKDPDHAVDLGVQAEVFSELLNYWGLAAPHVIAHDYGGAVSLRTHLLHDASYASLALIDVVALRPWGSDFFRLVAGHPEVFQAQPPGVHRGALEAYINGASHRGLSSPELGSLTKPWLTPEGQSAFYRQIAAADERFTDEIQGRYPEIRFPTKIIWGRNDSWIPAERATRLAGMIPGADLELIDEAGHLIQFDAPAELGISLQRWLTQVAHIN